MSVIPTRTSRGSVDAGLGRAGLLERMGACEGILLEAGVDDARDGRVGREIHVEQLGADRVADQADVRHGGTVAMAEATSLRVTAEVGLERRERLAEPVLNPFEARRLVELELAFEIVAHARHDQGMSVAGDDHGERAHARPISWLAGQEWGIRTD